MSKRQAALAHQLQRSGCTLDQISKRLNVTASRVGHILSAGREPSDPVAPFIARPHWTPYETSRQRTAFIIKLYRKGVSVLAIMRATGITEGGIRSLLSAHKIRRVEDSGNT